MIAEGEMWTIADFHRNSQAPESQSDGTLKRPFVLLSGTEGEIAQQEALR